MVGVLVEFHSYPHPRTRRLFSENLSSGNKKESKRLTRRRRRIALRGRRRRRGPKLRPTKPLELTDRRTTVRSRSAGLSTGRNSYSRRETTGRVTMRRLVLLRAKGNLEQTRRTGHPQSLLRMLQRLSCMRTTDFVGGSLSF